MENDSEFAIRSTLANDPDYADLVQEFVAGMSVKRLDIQKFMISRDLKELQRAIHQLRGSCGGYGFQSLSVEAGRIEDRMKAPKPFEDYEALLINFLSLLSRISSEPVPER